MGGHPLGSPGSPWPKRQVSVCYEEPSGSRSREVRGRRCERDGTVRRVSGSKSTSQCTEDGAAQAFLEPRLGDRLGRAPGRAGTRPPARGSWASIAGRRQGPPWAGPQGSRVRSVQREGGTSGRRAVPETGRRLGLPGWQLWRPSSWAAGAGLPSRRAGPRPVSASELHDRAPGPRGGRSLESPVRVGQGRQLY